MLRVRAIVLFLMATLFAITVVHADDFASMPGNMEKIFPERYDDELSRLYRPEDRLVFIFREMTLAQFNQSQNRDALLNGYLKKALNRYWLLESTEFKKTFLAEPEYFLTRIKRYLKKLPCTCDQAAFAFVFASLTDSVTEIKPLEKVSSDALQSLKDVSRQKAYADLIGNSQDFYRRIPTFLKPVIKLEQKIDSLIEELQQKFILEKMILAIDSLIPQKGEKMREALVKLRETLTSRLHEKIISNLEVQLESGLEADAVTGIARSSQGIMISQVLYHGRIRTFVKEMQKAENTKQLDCFIPVLRKIRSSLFVIKSRLSDSCSLATLEKMLENLDNMAVVLRLNLRNKKEESASFKQLVDHFDREISAEAQQEILLAQ